MVDIIQAVGRVIRKAEGKQIGTIVIPVFIDETEDADHILSQSAFEPVWQVLKALRAHDHRLADELDQLRLSLGRRSKSGGRINLPDNIHLDVPRLLLRDFEQAFYVRTVEQTTDKPRLNIEQILAWADAHQTVAREWPRMDSGPVIDTYETWAKIDKSLRAGVRGLPGGSSLAQLLAEHRGVRNIKDLSPLSVERVLEWADEYKDAIGVWPRVHSGRVSQTDETWLGIDSALRAGRRNLPNDSSLATLLAEHRDVRNLSDLPDLTIEQIVAWADVYKTLTGDWPNRGSGLVAGTDETWAAIDGALKGGGRGLPRGSSLAKVLARHRGVRNAKDLPSLTIEKILEWVDRYKVATGGWPTRVSGEITDADETWSGVSTALVEGIRGLPGDSSLAKLLAEQRGFRNRADLPRLTIDEILAWVDAHKSVTGHWPTAKSGLVTGTEETWLGIDTVLRRGVRGLPNNSSLAKLLSKYRSVRNAKELPELTIEQILCWVDNYKAAVGNWPSSKSGQVTGTGETWAKINTALFAGVRGLPGGSSLPKLLDEHHRVRNNKDLPKLTIDQILHWIDGSKDATGEWPTRKSGQITGTDETWAKISSALVEGLRGLPRGSSLPRLLAEHRGVRNVHGLARLTIGQILEWADAYKARTGNWPKVNSGTVTGTDETWAGISSALSQGNRGLPMGSSLSKLLSYKTAESER